METSTPARALAPLENGGPPDTGDVNLDFAINAVTDIARRLEFAALAGITHKGTRDMWEEFGYDRKITAQQYLEMYLRDPVAKRVNDGPPDETWRQPPRIRQLGPDGQPQENTEWERKVADLIRRTKAWSIFHRADVLAGLGRYSAVLIGSVRSRGRLDTELQRDRIRGPDDIGYLRAFMEKDAEIMEWEDDTSSPRFGHPRIYRLQLKIGDEGASVPSTELVPRIDKLGGVPVHHSRIIHFADNQITSDIFGRPRLEVVFNVLYDIQKVWGSAAESYWRNVAGILHANVDPKVNLVKKDPETGNRPLDELRDQLLDVHHKIERVMATHGVSVDHIGGGDPDPRGTFQVLRSIAAAGANQPQRILFGSERGELASSNDRARWLTWIESRQGNQIDPWIIHPFFDRLVSARAIPAPENGYRPVWPNLFELTDKERAEIARLKATADSEFARAEAAGASSFEDTERRESLGLPAERPAGGRRQMEGEEDREARGFPPDSAAGV